MRPLHLVALLGLAFGLACSGPCGSSGTTEDTVTAAPEPEGEEAKALTPADGMRRACAMLARVQKKLGDDEQKIDLVLRKMSANQRIEPVTRSALQALRDPQTRSDAIKKALKGDGHLGACRPLVVGAGGEAAEGLPRTRPSRADALRARDPLKAEHAAKREAEAAGEE